MVLRHCLFRYTDRSVVLGDALYCHVAYERVDGSMERLGWKGLGFGDVRLVYVEAIVVCECCCVVGCISLSAFCKPGSLIVEN